MLNLNNTVLWNRLHAAAEELGTDLHGLNDALCLADGTLEFMEEYGVEPSGEILVRLRRLLGGTAIAPPDCEPMYARKNIFVFSGGRLDDPYSNMDRLEGTMTIDRPAWDDGEYLGLTVKDETMRGAHIHQGDIVIIRRQALAEDNSLVAAEVDGEPVIRRFFRRKDVVWLETDGCSDNNETIVSENLHSAQRKIKILGKVVTAVRIFDDGFNLFGDTGGEKTAALEKQGDN